MASTYRSEEEATDTPEQDRITGALADAVSSAVDILSATLRQINGLCGTLLSRV